MQVCPLFLPPDLSKHVVGTPSSPKTRLPSLNSLCPSHSRRTAPRRRVFNLLCKRTACQIRAVEGTERPSGPEHSDATRREVIQSSASCIRSFLTHKNTTSHGSSRACCRGSRGHSFGADRKTWQGEGRALRRASVVPSRSPPWQRILESALLGAMQMRC